MALCCLLAGGVLGRVALVPQRAAPDGLFFTQLIVPWDDGNASAAERAVRLTVPSGVEVARAEAPVGWTVASTPAGLLWTATAGRGGGGDLVRFGLDLWLPCVFADPASQSTWRGNRVLWFGVATDAAGTRTRCAQPVDDTADVGVGGLALCPHLLVGDPDSGSCASTGGMRWLHEVVSPPDDEDDDHHHAALEHEEDDHERRLKAVERQLRALDEHQVQPLMGVSAVGVTLGAINVVMGVGLVCLIRRRESKQPPALPRLSEEHGAV
jgi:hypothetical protein